MNWVFQLQRTDYLCTGNKIIEAKTNVSKGHSDGVIYLGFDGKVIGKVDNIGIILRLIAVIFSRSHTLYPLMQPKSD